MLCILILLEKWQLIRITFHQLINKKTKRRRRTGSKARSKPSVRAKMHETCGGFTRRENKTLRGFLSRCKYWWYILFIFFFTFPVTLRSGQWIMWGVAKVIFQAGKFIVLYFLSCVICKLLRISKIITAVLSTLESLQLHYVRMFCVHTYTLPHPTFTHAHTGIHQERKQTAKVLILLLQNIWQFCWMSPQKTHPPSTAMGKGFRKGAASYESLHCLISESVSKKQSHDNS